MKKNVKDLLSEIIAVHDPGKQWGQLQTLEAALQIGGITWGIKGHECALSHSNFFANLHEQHASWNGVFAEDFTATFVPESVKLLNQKGELMEELANPKSSFQGHTIQTPWNRSQLIYFASYATWNYLTLPYTLMNTGIVVNEIGNEIQNEKKLTKLEVIFPDNIITHSKRQVLYYGEDLLLQRHDYWPEILGGVPATQIVEDYKWFSGIQLATKRRIYFLNEADNSYQTDPVLVSIDVLNVKFK